ncbi:CDP-diacylglycerol--serine O-phosphatidyltransferase [Halosquirtibacter xylanolyticus]|uniref:CDP-diacylglycerol--serine O-phosphatidyltransferase n=1 Tax=Halosquirtibacter xylanolyticus TaxID=3374599 RepID=UPI0037480EE9|nr:CDP-diacylglycerol--serine O-phosphatidyltransferase [Prolixibacteraceae bacterium]
MIKKHIPNSITSLNIISGVLAVYFALYGELKLAVIAIFCGAIFDFCDGLVARALKAYSDIGKELDSLADMITFGFAPGALLFGVLQITLEGKVMSPMEVVNSSYVGYYLCALVIPVFSGLRLAKFNVDTRQSTSFIGMPTPANAIFWASLALLCVDGVEGHWYAFMFNPTLLAILAFATSFLLVSEVPMFSFKFKNLSFKENKIRFFFLAVVITLISCFGVLGITFAMLLYVVLSVAQCFFCKS